jgi:ribosomal protein S18 acetylase RimI-like enzyme
MNLTLRPMDTARIAAYLGPSMEQYVEEVIATGRTREQAQANADLVTQKSFPGGEAAPGNEVYDVIDKDRDGDEPVGILWIAEQSTGSWWIYDIEMQESQRGKGYGRATMLLAEDRVRELGGTTLGLNVFGTNATARHLYESLGFEPTAIQMRKGL